MAAVLGRFPMTVPDYWALTIHEEQALLDWIRDERKVQAAAARGRR